MPAPSVLLDSILAAPQGLTLSDLLSRHPEVARRTAQRWLGQWSATALIVPMGAGPARRYLPGQTRTDLPIKPIIGQATWQTTEPDGPGYAHVHAHAAFPAHIPLSVDSRDVLAYVSQALPARKPVGYQRDFLDAYEPNLTFYLPEALRRQLHGMGQTAQAPSPAGTYSRAILNRLLIDLSWASSHLEGNTYSRLDTRALIEHGRSAKGKAAIETQMILNHKAAIELLVENIETVGFNSYTLMNLHSALAENLLPNIADEGRIRLHAVEIGQSVYRPMSTPSQLAEALSLLLAKVDQIADPFEQSFFVMVHLPYLQPFADINKRTSRLAANLPLFRANLCPLTFLDVPQSAYSLAMLGVYEMTRVELLRDVYVWAYERATQEYLTIRQELAQPDPLRLRWRELIKHTVHAVVTQPGLDAVNLIAQQVRAAVPPGEQAQVQALIVQELRRLHEGVLARYGLRPADFIAWQKAGR